jgi:hypothetical protein
VFRVGGTIALKTAMYVRSPYLTVAGQTAPGGGIQLDGRGIGGSMVRFETSDVVWRYTRLRKGYNAATGSQGGDVVSILAGANRVIFDHNSVAWSQDENLTAWDSSGGGIRNITVSTNMVSEPLYSHPTNMMTGASSRAWADAMVDLDYHHNFLSNSGHRNPLAKNKRLRWVNNIHYNWYLYAVQIGGGMQGDVVGNVFKRGPLGSGSKEIQVFPQGNSESSNGSPSLYVAGNVGPYNATGAADNWTSMVAQVTGENGSQVGGLSTSYRRTTSLPPVGIPIVSEPAKDLNATLIPTVGASRRLDCNGAWVANRDSTDARLINEYLTGTGPSVRPSREPGFPVLAAGTPCTDSDSDGMPNVWETARGLNPSDAADGRRINADGYSNLEKYLNGP